ncbi:hypothetical protein K439DRAFT_1325212 [Ramaria rubella]|nr:hypothetical protein K439DRAFT_1325212 [Ramaria rubella]
MIAEILLVLAGHDSSLFQGLSIHPSFTALLHPGEQQSLESLAHIAARYRRVRSFCISAIDSNNRYICALCSTLRHILQEDYETLVVETESKILCRDDTFVGRSSFVPISSVRAIFSEWDAPFKALEMLVDQLEDTSIWPAGRLIDLLLERANSGVHAISSLFSRISIAVQQLWSADLSAFLIHGSVSLFLPLARETSASSTSTYVLEDGAMPSCVSDRTRDSIIYVGRAIATVKASSKSKQFPRSMAVEHAKLLDGAYPQDRHRFERVIEDVRNNISEWLWLNVLTREDVEGTVESLASYFLLRNGEFGLALIREFERLKLSRIISKPSSRHGQMIREQDLHLAMLRASLGTSAQLDPTLTRLHFVLPAGPLRPLLPSLQSTIDLPPASQHATFDDMLLGTQLRLTYALPWPLDLFLTSSALSSYNSLFAFLSTIRRTHVRVLDCWVSLSNAQRARRRWTGTGEGGTEEDREVREGLLRYGWGCARTMNWFLEVVMEYVWCDAVDEEYGKLKAQLRNTRPKNTRFLTASAPNSDAPTPDAPTTGRNVEKGHLDFSTLRILHNAYLNHLLNNTFIAQPLLSSTLRSIFETCEHFAGQIARWGGDVLPPLLFEGSLVEGGAQVGEMVRNRWKIVKAINEKLTTLLETFYEQLALMISQPLASNVDISTRSFMMNTSTTFQSSMRPKGLKTEFPDGFGETRRHVERLLLRLDFSGGFSNSRNMAADTMNTGNILRQGGLA